MNQHTPREVAPDHVRFSTFEEFAVAHQYRRLHGRQLALLDRSAQELNSILNAALWRLTEGRTCREESSAGSCYEVAA